MSIYGKLGVVNTNLMANAAYQGMESTNRLLSVHQNRIATLKKVNGSADDPAGYVMASGMKIEMDGMDVSADNIGSAQNMINIANNGASSIKDLLTEMRKKALEASDGSKSDDQRSAIQSQISQYLSEIQDSVSQTTWNGKVLLDGNASFGFQTGPNDGDVTNLAIGLDFNLGLTQNRLANGLGATDIQFGAVPATVADGGNPTIGSPDDVIDADWTIEFVGENSYNVSYTTPGSSESHKYGTTFTMDAQFEGHGIDLTDFALVDPTGSKQFAEGDILTFSTKATRDQDHFDQTKTLGAGSDYELTQNLMIDGSAVDGLVGGEEEELGKPGDLIQYKIEVTEGSTDLTASDATLEINTRVFNEEENEWGDWVTGDSMDAGLVAGYAATFDGSVNDHHAKGLTMTLDATDKLTAGDTFIGSIQIQKDGHVVTDSDGVGVNLDGVAGQGVINLSTKNGAKASLNKLDAALSSVNDELGNMGAMTKRLDIKANLLEGRKTQVGAAVSRIEDADLISEQLEIAKLQVLQQANLSLMSQAQQAPRMVLQIMGIGG